MNKLKIILSPTNLWCQLLMIFAISFIPIFYHLAEAPIRIWDEAIYAVNSLEMALNKEFFVYHVDGKPSLYNVKPPMVIWLQTFMIWLLGANEWAIRLPSALAAFFTCVAVFFFAKRNLNTPIAFFAVLFLITTQGYIKPHVTRTGDLDSVLIFFITAYTLLYFEFLIKNPEKKNLYLNLVGLGVFLAFFSKSVAGLMPVLGLLIGTIAVGKGKEVLKNKHVYIVSILVVLACVGFYLFREYRAAGYLEVVILSEYLRFIKNIMPWHEHPYWFYAQNMYDVSFFPYIVLLPLSIFTLFSKNSNFKTFSILALCFTVSYFLLISHPAVKLPWYDAPLYPILSLLLGIIVYQIVNGFIKFVNVSPLFIWLPLIFFSYPYYQIYLNNQKDLPIDALEFDGYAIRELYRTDPLLKNYKVLLVTGHEAHRDVANFYAGSLTHFHGYNIHVVNHKEKVIPGDTVLCSQEENINYLKEMYDVEVLKEVYMSKLLHIKGLAKSKL